jgi:hypothetical protein
MLAFAAAALVPIVLHLIMRPNPRHVLFPALRFIRQRKELNQRRLRWRHLVLLALRTAVLCLVALALSRPTVSCTADATASAGPRFVGGKAAPVSAVLVVDTSPRMLYVDGGRSRLQVAEELARYVLDQLPEGSEVAVLRSDSVGGTFQIDVEAARARIDALQAKVTYTPERLPRLVVDALGLLQKARHRSRELYLFTDHTVSAWPDDERDALRRAVEETPDAALYLIDVGVAQPQNTALRDLEPFDQVVARNSNVALRVDVVRQGEPVVERRVQLFLLQDGQLEPAGQQLIDRLEDGQTRPLDFVLSGLQPGTHQGEIRILGRDGLSVDDSRYFTIDVKPAWPVLLAAPAPAEHYAFDLREALEPYAARQEQRARFACQVVTTSELPAVELKQFPVVCLLDPPPLAAETWNRLSQYVARGGHLVVFLGRHALQDVASFNTPAAQQLLAGRLIQAGRAPAGQPYHLAPSGYQHPMLRKFLPYREQVPWAHFPVFRFWQLGPLADGARPVVSYNHGQAAIVERPLGDGIAVTVTTPVSDELDGSEWNRLPNNGIDVAWPFWLLSNEMLLYLVGTSDEQLNYAAQRQLQVVLHLPRDRVLTKPFRLTTPGGRQSLRMPDPQQPHLELSALDEVGNYRVDSKEEGLDRGFSINLPYDWTDLTRATPEHVQSLFGERPLAVARSMDDLKRLEGSIQQRRLGTELFPLLIMLAAVVLAAEHVLANRFYQRAQSEEGTTPQWAAT